MTTQDPTPTPAVAPPSSGDAMNTATMGFFHKYQKAILYSAGIFALLSFSISAEMFGFFDFAFRTRAALPTLELAGREIQVTEEDDRVATLLLIRSERIERGVPDPVVVLPQLRAASTQARSGDRMRDVLGALRRLAIESGVEVSDDEVDKAIQQGLRVVRTAATEGAPTLEPVDLALRNGYASLEAYRAVLREAMRIGVFVRMQALAANTFDSGFIDELLEGEEKITLLVAGLDKEKLEKDLEGTAVSDEDLEAWIKGLEESEQMGFNYLDTNRVAIRAATLDLAQFDATQWTAELEGKEFSDEQVEGHYNVYKHQFYKKPAPENGEDGNGENGENGDDGKGGNGGNGGPSGAGQDPTPAPAGDGQGDGGGGDGAAPPQDPQFEPLDSVRDSIVKRLQAEEVFRGLWTQVQTAQSDAMRDVIDARVEAQSAKAQAQTKKDEAQSAADAAPDDADLKTALETAEQELETATTALEAADEAVDAARQAFDMVAALTKLTEGKTGFAIASVGNGAKLTADELRETDELGEWSQSWAATSVDSAGQLSTQVQPTKDKLFHFQVTDLDLRPLKPFADIKEKASEDYVKKQADEQAKEKGEAFEAKLEELASAARKTELDALDAEKKAELDKRLADWKAATQTRREKIVAGLERARSSDAESRATKAFQKQLENLDAELNDELGKINELSTALDEEYEQKIADERRKAYGDVLAQAAGESGFEISTIGPYSRNLASKGIARERFPKDVQFLVFGQARSLEEGDATELLEDFTNRALYVAVCTKVEPSTIEDISRRDVLNFRQTIEQSRASVAIQQSFSIDAIKQRYGWRPAKSAEETADAADGGDGKPSDG